MGQAQDIGLGDSGDLVVATKLARKARKAKLAPANPPDTAPDSQHHAAAHWVADMQGHFVQEGYYRSEDLVRLLGDPRDSLQVSVGGSLFFTHLPK